MAGVVLWKGKSRIDGEPIVAILTGIGRASKNGKTGDMLQTWILRADMHPIDALNTGADVSVCGGCQFRPSRPNGQGRTCYVNIMGPASIYNAFVRGVYPVASAREARALVSGRAVRFGAYGDPAAVPVTVWNNLAGAAEGYTGYTHQWRNVKLRDTLAVCMASVETDADVTRANRLGFGTFRVIPQGQAIAPDVMHCPASTEAGKLTTCIQCKACDGSKRNVAIHVHGSGVKHSRLLPVLPVLAVA